jgi:hypothetical protein
MKFSGPRSACLPLVVVDLPYFPGIARVLHTNENLSVRNGGLLIAFPIGVD